MLFAGWEVRIVKNCDRGLENAARGSYPFSETNFQDFFRTQIDIFKGSKIHI